MRICYCKYSCKCQCQPLMQARKRPIVVIWLSMLNTVRVTAIKLSCCKNKEGALMSNMEKETVEEGSSGKRSQPPGVCVSRLHTSSRGKIRTCRSSWGTYWIHGDVGLSMVVPNVWTIRGPRGCEARNPNELETTPSRGRSNGSDEIDWCH